MSVIVLRESVSDHVLLFKVEPYADAYKCQSQVESLKVLILWVMISTDHICAMSLYTVYPLLGSDIGIDFVDQHKHSNHVQNEVPFNEGPVNHLEPSLPCGLVYILAGFKVEYSAECIVNHKPPHVSR